MLHTIGSAPPTLTRTQERLEAERCHFFPAAHNRFPAYLRLFDHLLEEHLEAIQGHVAGLHAAHRYSH